MNMATVLVVDDDAHICEVARFALVRDGYTVELAGDGAAALQRLTFPGIDLLVLDVLMPELDGLAVCRRLRVTSRVPVVFLSSRSRTS
jgi:two-component system OmpR family response regulator